MFQDADTLFAAAAAERRLAGQRADRFGPLLATATATSDETDERPRAVDPACWLTRRPRFGLGWSWFGVARPRPLAGR
jgi:hypothetical protein